MMEKLNVIGMPEEANDYEFVLCYYDTENQLHYVMHTENGFDAEAKAKSFTNPLILHNVRIQGKRREEPKCRKYRISGSYMATITAKDEETAEALFVHRVGTLTNDFEDFDSFYVDEVWED